MSYRIEQPTDLEQLAYEVPLDYDSNRLSIANLPSVRTVANTKISWAVEGLLANGTVNMIAAEAGAGKSTLALAIGGAVAFGSTFAGLATEKRPVLYLDRENPASAICERLDRLRISDGGTFKIWGGWVSEPAPDPTSPMVRAWVSECNPKPLIVTDSVVAFMPGDENNATDTRKYLHGFRQLADAGATVLLLHHTGRNPESEYRGSSDFKAAVDCAFLLTNIGDPARLERLRVRPTKTRFIGAGELVLRFDDADGFTCESTAIQPPRTNSEILTELLQANPGIGTRKFLTLAGDRGVARDRACGFLENGIKAGTIRADGRSPKRHTWVGANV